MSDALIHLVRKGRYPHVIVRGAGIKHQQTQKLADVTCGLCLRDVESFLIRMGERDATSAR